jgi:hypothetical protein
MKKRAEKQALSVWERLALSFQQGCRSVKKFYGDGK